MYKFNDLVSKQTIEERISAYQIYKYYCPKLKLGSAVTSPLRKDNNPSFGLYYSKSGKLKYNDFASQDRGDVYEFVQRLFNISFNDALHKINIDFNLKLIPNRHTSTTIAKTQGIIVPDIEITAATKRKIVVYKRQWNNEDKKYWGYFGLTLQEVFNSVTYPILAFRIDNGTTILTDKLAYCMDFYDDGDGIMMRKIYQPYNKKMKWRTNLTPLVVDGIKELPSTGDLLIITKSRKDRLVLKKYGYAAISVNSENSFIPIKVFEKLKLRFKNIALFFDSDTAGRTNSEIISKKYEISNIQIAENWGVTDIAEFRYKYGDTNTKQILKYLTNDL
jgi:hypothetical protein